MAITFWQPGRRLFSSAGVLMILTAFAHTAGHFSPSSGPAEDQLVGAMRDFRMALGFGMNPSMLDIYSSLSLTMTITFVTLGTISLLLAGSADTTNRLLRRAGWVNATWVGAFLAVNAYYQIPPPLISAAIIELVLLAAVLTPSRRPA